MIGVMSIQEALSKAQELKLDLIEIAPNATPPVARIDEYNRFLYVQNKKKRESNKSKKSGDVKEIWLSPFIAENDLLVRVEKGKQLLKESGKLRIVVRFYRRQISKKQFGFDIINRYITLLGDVHIDKQPSLMGFSIIAVVGK